MGKIQLAKTTVEIDKNLLFLAKKLALEENKTLKEIFTESLVQYLAQKKSSKKGSSVKLGGSRRNRYDFNR